MIILNATEIAYKDGHKDGYEKSTKDIQDVIAAKIKGLDRILRTTGGTIDYTVASAQKEILKELSNDIKFPHLYPTKGKK